MACVICSSVGDAVLPSKAAAAIICPVWQYPHCATSSAIHACCSTCKPFAESPSMVVIFLPATCETGVEQERVALPSTCTVHAPHNPAPQPYFVPVSSSVSRNTQSSGVSGATVTRFSLPLTRSVNSAIDFLDHHPTQVTPKLE